MNFAQLRPGEMRQKPPIIQVRQLASQSAFHQDASCGLKAPQLGRRRLIFAKNALGFAQNAFSPANDACLLCLTAIVVSVATEVGSGWHKDRPSTLPASDSAGIQTDSLKTPIEMRLKNVFSAGVQ